MQYDLLFTLCCHIDDADIADRSEEGIPAVGGGLFQTDEEGEPILPVYSLHEDILGFISKERPGAEES
ncbi:MAG: hypothetical protein KY468_03780 [Armatimonadetes bacterium]|nr:hypothetical protein [Armatimonadota bacterium]